MIATELQYISNLLLYKVSAISKLMSDSGPIASNTEYIPLENQYYNIMIFLNFIVFRLLPITQVLIKSARIHKPKRKRSLITPMVTSTPNPEQDTPVHHLLS